MWCSIYISQAGNTHTQTNDTYCKQFAFLIPKFWISTVTAKIPANMVSITDWRLADIKFTTQHFTRRQSTSITKLYVRKTMFVLLFTSLCKAHTGHGLHDTCRSRPGRCPRARLLLVSMCCMRTEPVVWRNPVTKRKTKTSRSRNLS